MKRVIFEKLERIVDFDVDVRSIHKKSSNLSVLSLMEGESLDLPVCDFQTHLVILSGEVALEVEGHEETFKCGCMASILSGLKVKITAKQPSRILIIMDDPLWTLRERRSVRRFSSIPVPEELIRKILDFSRLAPNAGNLQPWRIYLTNKDEIKKELARASYGQDHVKEAPWVVIITAVPEESASKYGDRGRKLYSLQDTASLVTYIMLTAKAYGLDTCWVGAFDDEKVWRIIGAPQGEVPVAIIPIGYGQENPQPPYRKPLDRILRVI